MKAKKVIALALAAVLLIATSVAATVAYFMDSEKVVNTFTVGRVGISLDEKDTDDSTPDKDRDASNRYHLQPGLTYEKDPTIHVDADSENCYLFVQVENGIVGLEDDQVTVAGQMIEKGWQNVSGDLWVYGTVDAPTPVAKNADVVVFTEFKIKDSATNADLSAYAPVKTGEGDSAATTYTTITVTAYAVQTAGFENMSASAIWNAAFN